MTIEEKVAVIISRADAEDREAYEEITGWFYRAACRLKVKMPTRPFLVAVPRGVRATCHPQPDNGQSRGQKAGRAGLTVIRGGHSVGHEQIGASEERI